jgi:hypothetical protein
MKSKSEKDRVKELAEYLDNWEFSQKLVEFMDLEIRDGEKKRPISSEKSPDSLSSL